MVSAHRWCRVGRQRGNQGRPNHALEHDRGSDQTARHAPRVLLVDLHWSGAVDGLQVPELLPNPATRLMTVANTTALSEYDNNPWRSTVAWIKPRTSLWTPARFDIHDSGCQIVIPLHVSARETEVRDGAGYRDPARR